MASHGIFSRVALKSMLRVVAGVVIAVLLYQIAQNFAISDCGELQLATRKGGVVALVKILLGGSLLAIVGAPSALVAILAGLLTGPIIGAPISSMALVIASVFWWSLGHFFFQDGLSPASFDARIEKSPWYVNMMRQNSNSGFHWTIIHGFIKPVPYALLGLIVGSKVRHLSFLSYISGIFIGSIILLAGYCLAGASIGCAVVNHAQGYDFAQYKLPMLISCMILALISRIQSIAEERLKGP